MNFWQVDSVANLVLNALEELLQDVHSGVSGSETFEKYMRIAVLCRHYLLAQGIGPVSIEDCRSSAEHFLSPHWTPKLLQRHVQG